MCHAREAATPHGLVTAWLLPTSSGDVFPAFRYVSKRGNVEIKTVQEPIWIGLQGDELLWVTASGDGWSTGAFAVDLWPLVAP